MEHLDKYLLAKKISDIDVYGFRDAYDTEDEGIEAIIKAVDENPWVTVKYLLDTIDELNQSYYDLKDKIEDMNLAFDENGNDRRTIYEYESNRNPDS